MSRHFALFAALLCSCLFGVTQAVAAEDVFGARYPALSPDAETVVFSYWGDLWSAPVDGSSPAQRITDHLAIETVSRFSPDGSEIAFMSTRSGNTDIWIMPAGGGVARQVTTFNGTDTLCSWSPDGKRIVFSSQRDLWAADLFTVDAYAKNAPVQLTYKDHDPSADATLLDDGGFIFTRRASRWWRKNYRGTRQGDIWQMDQSGHATQLTDHKGYDSWPMVSSGGSTVFYVTDKGGIANIWALDLASGKDRQLTKHTTDGVQFPSISPDGSTMVYEQAGQLWTVATGGGKSTQLAIEIGSEGKDNWVKKVSFNNEADDYAVSPHGKYVIISVDGDLWAIRDPGAFKDDEKPDQDLSQALRLTSSDGSREIHPAFSPENTVFAYCSDADGDYDVYLYDLQEMSSRKLTDTEWDDLSPRYDPSDANRLFYLSGNRKLVVHDLEADTVETVLEADLRRGTGHGSFAISHDGEWVGYTDDQSYGHSEVFIKDTRGKLEAVNVTRHDGNEGSPQWSPDGKYFMYSSRRYDESRLYVIELVPEADSYEMEFLFEGDRPKDEESGDGKEEEESGNDDEDENDDEDDEDEENGDDDDEEDDEEESDDEDEEEADDDEEALEIDFYDIQLRAKRVSNQTYAGSAIFSGDSEWVLYSTRPTGGSSEVWAVKTDGSSGRKLLSGSWSSPKLADKGKRTYYRDGGTVKYVKFGDGRSKGTGTISAKGEYWLNKRLRWHQMYREAWRGMREQFYDANMHGADWDAVYEQYLPYVDAIGTPEEFALMFSEVLGELNASHLGITMREKSYSATGPSTGHLGLEFDASFAGPGLKVSKITYQGPADKPGVELNVGDIVLSIDGAKVSASIRWLDLLDDKSGDPVALTVADGDATREVVLKATSHSGYRRLLYREWEKANEDYIEEKTNGRVGYIHIRSMSGGELTKFEREFVAEHIGKDAIIVDVRFNGGGLIHEQLFDFLDRSLFGYSAKRDQPLTRQPAHAFQKPTALLINSRSASDAEIFPSGWRTLGLGPIIGIDTYGAVIGTGSYGLIDGSRIRMPLFGWYDNDMRNLELGGTPPDYYVDVHPDDLRNGVDAQLDKAIELVLAELD